MAKKRRTKAQKAATRKMIAANRRRRHGRKTTRRSHRRSNPWTGSRKQLAAARRNIKKAAAGKRRRKACRRAAGRRGAAKRHRRAMPAMPKACRPKRRKGRRRNPVALAAANPLPNPRRKRRTHKGQHCATWKRGKKKSHARSHGKRKAGHRKSARHVRAGKKGAATRASRRHYKKYGSYLGHDLPGDQMSYENPIRRRRHRRRGRRHNPVHHHRSHRSTHPFRMRRNPLSNPLGTVGEVVAGLFGVGTGYAFASVVDRALATHALTANTAGNGFIDTPAAGQIYDSEAPLLPLWQNWMRLGAALGVIFVPGFASRFVRNAKAKSFLQLASYGAGAKVGGKLIEDAIATFLPTQKYALQLYGPEIAAQARLAQVGSGVPVPMTQAASGTSASQPAGFFAGPPKELPARTGVGDPGLCAPGIVTDALQGAQNQFADGQPNFYADSVPFAMRSEAYNPYDPLNEGGLQCCPLPMQSVTLNNLPGGTIPSPPSPIPAPPAPCPPGQITMPDGSCAPPPIQASTQMTAPVVPPMTIAPVGPAAPVAPVQPPNPVVNPYIGPR